MLVGLFPFLPFLSFPFLSFSMSFLLSRTLFPSTRLVLGLPSLLVVSQSRQIAVAATTTGTLGAFPQFAKSSFSSSRKGGKPRPTKPASPAAAAAANMKSVPTLNSEAAGFGGSKQRRTKDATLESKDEMPTRSPTPAAAAAADGGQKKRNPLKKEEEEEGEEEGEDQDVAMLTSEQFRMRFEREAVTDAEGQEGLDLSKYSRTDLVFAANSFDSDGCAAVVRGGPEDLGHAIKCFQYSLLVKQEALDTEVPQIFDTLVTLGTLHSKKPGDEEMAKQAFEQVYRIANSFFDESPESEMAAPPPEVPKETRESPISNAGRGREGGQIQEATLLPVTLNNSKADGEDQDPEDPIDAELRNFTDLAAGLEAAIALAEPGSKGESLALTTSAYLYLSRQTQPEQQYSLTLYKKAIEVEKTRLGPECPEAARIGTLLVAAYGALGEIEKLHALMAELSELASRHPEEAFNPVRATLESLKQDPPY